jgi:hypothetical protein
VKLLKTAFRSTLVLYPKKFRDDHSNEMAAVFAERISELSISAAIAETFTEIFDVAQSALRFRLTGFHFARVQPAMLGVVGTFIVAAAFTLRSLSWAPSPSIVAPLDSIDFRAQDPAGEFTIAIRHGSPVAATIDRIPVPAGNVRHVGDSIQLVGPRGNVVLAVAYYRERARIEWQPRPIDCRGRAVECAL